MELFKQAGGGAIVEVSCREYGRDGNGLAELSRRSGVHVIAATGHIMEGYWRGVIDLSDRADPVARRRDGRATSPRASRTRPTCARASSRSAPRKDAVHPDEEKMLRAAAIVQRDLGVPITTHTTKGTIPRSRSGSSRRPAPTSRRCASATRTCKLDYEQHLAVVEVRRADRLRLHLQGALRARRDARRVHQAPDRRGLRRPDPARRRHRARSRT